jgi:catalase
MSDPQAGKPILTTRQGHPVHNNQQQRTVIPGLATMENHHFLERLPTDREHPGAGGARLRSQAWRLRGGRDDRTGDDAAPASNYTRAKLFQTRRPRHHPVSTVIGGRPEAAHDRAASRVKFRTETAPGYGRQQLRSSFGMRLPRT